MIDEAAIVHQPEREQLLDGLALASDGKGPLLQRDYWTVIAGCRTSSPTELLQILLGRFCELAPPELAKFSRPRSPDQPLQLGDVLQVMIRGAGTFRVRIVHVDRQSFTMATMRGHPECGRITFGAYRNPRGDTIFHVRSRARSSSFLRYLGFLAAGNPMQSSTWCELINRMAASVGDGTIGSIHVETARVEEDEGDGLATRPTFRASGD